MANKDGPYGLRAVGTLSGAPFCGNVLTCAIAAGDGTATFIGDAVDLAATGVTVDGVTYPGVQQATAGNPVFGVVVGFEPNRDNLSLQYRTASTEQLCRVAVADSSALFVAQEDGTMGIAAIGSHVNLIVGSGDTSTGLSGMEIDSSTAGSGAQALVVGVYNVPDNDPTLANAQYVIKFVSTEAGTDAPAGV